MNRESILDAFNTARKLRNKLEYGDISQNDNLCQLEQVITYLEMGIHDDDI